MSVSWRTLLDRLDPLLRVLDMTAYKDIAALQFEKLEAARENLRLEMLPDTAILTLPDWERCFELHPAEGDPVSVRQKRAWAAYIAQGGLSRPYFIQLAAAMGYTISISEYLPRNHGDAFGGSFGGVDQHWHWLVTIWMDTEVSFYDRCFGDPFGEAYTYFSEAQDLIALFEDLMPAHTTVTFEFKTL